jgi:hypothetical protein
MTGLIIDTAIQPSLVAADGTITNNQDGVGSIVVNSGAVSSGVIIADGAITNEDGPVVITVNATAKAVELVVGAIAVNCAVSELDHAGVIDSTTNASRILADGGVANH